jgi:S1-C subfamily serine protease
MFMWGATHLISDRNSVLKTTIKADSIAVLPEAGPYKHTTAAKKIDTRSFVRFEQTFVDSITKKETVIGTGSAAVIRETSSGSYILTNEHVCSISPKTIIKLALEGHVGSLKNVVRALDGETSQVKILKRNTYDDMCVVFAKDFHRPAVKLAPNAPIRGDEVYVVGAPKGYYSYKFNMVPILRGIFNGYDENWHSSQDVMAVYSLRIAPGNSGSAVFDKKGRLIGVVHSHFTTFDEITFGTTFEDTKNFIDIYLKLK